MAYRVHIVLACDTCNTTYAYGTQDQPLTVTEVKRYAVSDGWQAHNAHVACPKHATKRCDATGYRWFNEHIGTGGPAISERVQCSLMAGHTRGHRNGQYPLMEYRERPPSVHVLGGA